MSKEKEKRNCAFQYAYSVYSDTRMVEDTELITLSEAKWLYEKYYDDFYKRLTNDEKPEMAVWINMKDDTDYRETLVHLDWHFNADGRGGIYEEKRIYAPRFN